jgi:hypothetical protein
MMPLARLRGIRSVHAEGDGSATNCFATGSGARWLAPLLALLTTAASCPTPPPNPVPTPTPPPSPSMALRVQGNRLLLADGSDPRILGTIAGSVGDEPGWPLVSVEVLDAVKAAGLNWTHVRTGPFTAEGEAPQFAFYAKVPSGKYDLTKHNADFFGLLRTRISEARLRRIYVEVDLPMDRWPVQHRLSPWQAENNVQGEEHSGLSIFQSAPDPVHEAALRKIVAETCEFDNVVYSEGNEAFKSDSAAWASRVVQIVRELCPGRPIGANSAEGAAQADFTIFHQNAAPAPVANGHPVEVNEFEEPNPTPNGVIAQALKADRTGGYYMYWRGNHTPKQWSDTLIELGKIRAGTPPPTPSPEICPRPDFEDPVWALVCTRKPDPHFPTLPLCPADEANFFAPKIEVANAQVQAKHPTWVTDGCLNDLSMARVAEYLDAAAEEMRAQGVCAWHESDSVQAQQTVTRWHELHWIAQGSGCLLPANQSMVKISTGPPQPLPGPMPTPGPTPVPTPAPSQCPIPPPGTNWDYVLKVHGGQQIDLTPYVGNPTHTINQPWPGCGVNRCPLSVEQGDTAKACQFLLFGEKPIWGTSGGICRLVTRDDQPFSVKVADGSCALFAKGTVPSAPLSQAWEVVAAVPPCVHVDANNVCH